MDRSQFDLLARLVSSSQSRRSALAALLGAALLGRDPGVILAKGKRKVKVQAKAKAKAKPCYPGTSCTPGTGKNTSGCDFSGSTAFFERDVRGSNLSRVNFTGADLRGADFRGANLSGSCFVDVSLRQATLGSSVNLGGAIFCNAVMPDGSLNNSGCDKGTACCPTTPPGGSCNDFDGLCGIIAGACCEGLTCLSPPLSTCQIPCTNSTDCPPPSANEEWRCVFSAKCFRQCCRPFTK